MNDGARAGTQHISVMVNEVKEYLNAATAGLYLDCTLGGGGHSMAILQANPESRVIAIDRDERALARAADLFAPFGDRIRMQHAAFSDLRRVCGEERFDGILADLGISTDQLWENRGFSFNDECALDMRMDEKQPVTADSIVNCSSERELYAILKRGGTGREAGAVTKAIVRARPVKNTRELAEIVNRAARGLSAKKKINPATVAFQAIRMAVNGELEEIESLLSQVPLLSRKGGRLAVITFHSIEDKLVTRTMRDWEGGSTAPAWWPESGREAARRTLGKMVEKKAISPGEAEIEANPSARSARLRVFEFNVQQQ